MSVAPDTGRAVMLASIRRSLAVSGEERPRRAAVAERLAQAPAGVVPARGQGSRADRLATFRRMVEAAQAGIDTVTSAAAVPEAVAGLLRAHNLPASVRRGDDPRLAAMPWADTALSMATGRSDGADLVAVSHALAGVAESGTVVLVSGPDNPTTLNFLPDTHVVVVDGADVVGDYESAWARVRALVGRGAMPRTVNWITGPSRSADIEQTLLLGAHGPRRLHVVLIDAEAERPG